VCPNEDNCGDADFVIQVDSEATEDDSFTWLENNLEETDDTDILYYPSTCNMKVSFPDDATPND
jgi:hypothetical protein